ncbi:MAG: ATP-binding protein [Candidatus Competibacteraceae bacterium]
MATKAELTEKLTQLQATQDNASKAEDHQHLLLELQVHQTELELQNQELREAQQALEASRDRYADLYDFAPVGYVSLTGTGIIKEINLTAATLLGKQRLRLLEYPFNRFVADAERQKFFRHLLRCQTEGWASTELTLLGKNGPLHQVQLYSTQVQDQTQDFLYRTAITDITELKQAEEALRQAQAELEQRVQARTAELQVANDALQQEIEQRRQVEHELREAGRHKDEFLAMLAHELRNPLAPILNAAAILKRKGGQDEERLRWAIGLIDSQVRHMGRLLDDLLDVSRLQRSKITLQPVRLDIATIVAEAVETSRSLIEGRRHRLTLDLPAEPLWLLADATRLTQVLYNLLTNAAKFTPEGGHIELEVTREGEEAVIRVRDSGIGIAPSLLPRVFDLFSQADTSLAHSQGGLGIGLALVQNIVQLHGGNVQAYSEGEGRGSEFVLRLPALPQVEQVQDNGRPIQGASIGSAAGRKILMVEDHIAEAQTLEQVLQLAGHQVRVVYDGHSALKAAQRDPPEIVILDIGLPDIDGYEVARRLRGELGLDHILLIAMTGYGHDEARRQSREAGIDYHLVKPADPEALLTLLAAASKAVVH